MGRFGVVLRSLIALLLMLGLARAEEATPPDEQWQAVITAQVEAFRSHDASGAFQYSSAPFHKTFPNAEAFFSAIIGSGYGPIMDSSAHSFGKSAPLDANSVAQEVMFTGNDLSRYEAIYVLTKEEGGWRVSGVQLVKTPGMGV